MTAPSRLNTKYLLFAFVGVMLAYVLVQNESFVINTRHPVWKHYQPFKWWLLAHGLAGGCALVLSFMQFSDRLRQRHTKLHRIMGRLYVAAVFIASPLGIYIKFFQERFGIPRSFSIAIASHGALWMLTTGIAFIFILRGKVQQHRQWMVRSFFVGPLVFLGARVVLDVTGWGHLGAAAVETVVWVSLAFAILFADVLLQWHDLWSTRVPASKVGAVGI